MRAPRGWMGTVLVMLAWVLPASGAGTVAGPVDFQRDVRPILGQHCTACHGGVKQAGGVSFLQREKALASGKSGRPTVVPGQPEASELYRRVTLPATDDDHMPPREHGDGKGLSKAEVATLQRWIAQGARWGAHPMFVKPEPPPLPRVKDARWARSSLDRFVLARLEAERLRPSRPAPPGQWLRRATFDLTGLPPTEEELIRLEKGEETPEQAVDRLLGSAAYGERWAAMWMDLARYADTQGYEKDNGREVWPWRDWLVRALNEDMPFDQFTLRCLAGDLLPDATIDDRVATGFHRHTQTNTEGGTDDEEYRLAAVVDRVNTTWTVWQGTTFGCVQCHAHPYDAFAQEDYYRFLALWNSTEDADLSDDFPRLRVPHDPAQRAEAERWDREATDLRARLNDVALPRVARDAWRPLPPSVVQGPKSATFTVEGHEVRVDGTVPNGATFVMPLPSDASFTALRLDILPRNPDPRKLPEHGAVVGHLWLEVENPERVAAAKVEAEKVKSENQAMAEEDSRREAEAKKAGKPAPKKREPRPLPTGMHVVEFGAVYAPDLAGPYDPEESLRPGWAGGGAFPKLFGPRWLVFVPKEPVRVTPGDTLRLHLKHEIFDAETKGSIVHHFKLSSSSDPGWTELVQSPERAALQARLAEVRKQRDAMPSASTLVMRDRPASARRETRLLVRGNFLAKDQVVEGGAPAGFPPLPPGPADRLAAARWLVSPDNPLTARVQVNRLWAELFGAGIVETVEDMGSTGLPASHPELLDHLATRFQGDLAWSVKRLLREVVLSATYRQDHRASAGLVARDPRNRLLARGPRARLTAEMVRDQALAVSGLLSPKVGGPPVMPPQPEGVWQVVYNSSQWVEAKGPDRHRRAVYTYWRRTSPYPSFLTFDASSREMCTARRIPTSTPLQALVTLNDPVYAEAAMALAGRAEKVAEGTAARARWMLRRVLGREPGPKTVERLARLHDAAVERYRAMPEEAARTGGSPERAAWALVASTVLNLDEALAR